MNIDGNVMFIKILIGKRKSNKSRGEIDMTTKNKKIVVIALAAILLLILSLMVFGIIDLSLYKANFNVGSSCISVNNKSQESYALDIRYQDEAVYKHLFLRNNEMPIDVIAKIEDYQYKGNYYWPLVKRFTVDYKCTFSCPNLKESDINNFNGSVEGHIEAEITGLCSTRKAKKLAKEKAIEIIKKNIIDTLQ